MNKQEFSDEIDRLVHASEHIQYKGISIGQALKIPFINYLMMREENEGITLKIILRIFRVAVFILARIFIGTLWNFRKENHKYSGKKIAVIADYEGHVEDMTLCLSEQFEKNEFFFLTSSYPIFKRLRKTFDCLNIFKQIYFFSFKSLTEYYRYYRKICQCINPENVLFKMELFSKVCSILTAIDYYHNLFNSIDIIAVITMSDRQWNEYVITKTARQHGILTYTNQHGWLALPTGYVPIASDKIFTWGDESRKHLIQHGVPDKQIVISGNPKFDKVYSYYLPERDKIRTDFQTRYALKPGLPVVTYLSSGIVGSILTYKRAFEFFRCFCQVADLPVNAVIKVRPAKDDKSMYQTWLRKLNISSHVPIFDNEPLFEILAATDIAVTTITSAGMDVYRIRNSDSYIKYGQRF